MKTTFHNTKVSKEEYLKLSGSARAYAKELEKIAGKATYTRPESALSIVGDTRYQNALIKALAPLKHVSHVVLIGIGGSSLGTEAIYAALKTPESPRLTILDTVNDEAIDHLTKDLDTLSSPEEVAFVIVTKSGATMETMVNATTLLHFAKERFGDAIRGQIVCVGDAGTAFNTYAQSENLLFLEIPHPIGGRYSVFSAAGMVPLALLGIDTQALRKGARAACTAQELAASADHAAILAYHAQSGKDIFDLFTFNDRLERIGSWYRQLLAESIGKATTRTGRPFTLTMLPTVSTARDLHSMAQLYLSGKKNIHTRFLYTKGSSARSISEGITPAGSKLLKGHTYGEVQDAIIDGVRSAYDAQGLAYTSTQMKQVDAHAIGLLLASLMCEVMCLGEILDINAFDQPNVEAYKQRVVAALNGSA